MDTSKARADMELEVFMTSARANYDATGIFDGSGITVKKGSILSLEVTSDRIDVAQRDEAITPAGILKEDTYFDSPSAAAVFVCGRSANGWVEWKDASDKLLQEYRVPVQNQSSVVSSLASKVAPSLTSQGVKSGSNIVGLEGDEVTIEVDALAEEQENAKANYQHLSREYKQIQAQLPYPDVKPYDTTWLPGDLQDLQHKKMQNQPYWAKMSAVRAYTDTGDLYSGHIRFTGGGDRYFMEAPGLETKEWRAGDHRVMLIHVDDKHYKKEVDAWHYPDKDASIAFSRNISMYDRVVQSVDIVLDRSDSMYASITDNYLRNALKRNKNKLGFQSIIQTIQKKQDDIRSLPRSKSFVVQGCAGSGKTMVLLHRLRYLIYNKDIYGEDYYFLVPSTGFKKYIRDILAKFNITYGNVLSYQGYYRMLLGKADATLEDEASELVFPAEYLARIYSKAFMQDCYSSLFEMIIDQANSLSEFCDEKLNELIAREEERIAKRITTIKEETLKAVQNRASKIAEYLNIELNEYDHVAILLPAMLALVEKQKALIGSPEIRSEDIVIAADDPRVLADEKLQTLTADAEAEEARVKKASIFTVNSHRKKHQQLLAKRDAYYSELVERIVEEEKKIRAVEAAKLSIIFDGVTIKDVEVAYEESTTLLNDAQRELSLENDKQQNIMEVIASKHHDEISALTRMIEASGDIEARMSEWVGQLVPADQLKEFIQNGMDLYAAFVRYATDKKEQEAFRENHKLYARRTDREQQAYLNTLLFNICRKKVKAEFDIKICDIYKHYWYLSLYCNYLINGNIGKARPYFFIDECQDLSASEIELIRKLNNKPVMNLFGDINQVITEHGIRDWSAIAGDWDVLQLDENFRNTNQIVDFCNRAFPFRMEKIGVDMEAVEEFNSVDHALSKNILTNGATFVVKDGVAADDLKIILKGTAITEYKIYTVKEAKGLEFKHVVVIDRDMSTNEKYISYTRALAKLTVIHALPSLSDPNTKRIVEGDEEESA